MTSNGTFAIQHCWTGGKTLSNIVEWAVQQFCVGRITREIQSTMLMSQKRKAAIAIVISELLDEVPVKKRSRRGKTRHWIKQRQERGIFMTIIKTAKNA